MKHEALTLKREENKKVMERYHTEAKRSESIKLSYKQKKFKRMLKLYNKEHNVNKSLIEEERKKLKKWIKIANTLCKELKSRQRVKDVILAKLYSVIGSNSVIDSKLNVRNKYLLREHSKSIPMNSLFDN